MCALQARFLELLRLRYSSPLLRLPRAEHIQRQVRFLNTGPQQARPCLTLFNLACHVEYGLWDAGCCGLAEHLAFDEGVSNMNEAWPHSRWRERSPHSDLPASRQNA